MVGRLNPVLNGWANYFSLGSSSQAYRAVDRHVDIGSAVVVSKHKVSGRGISRFPPRYVYEPWDSWLQRATAQLPVCDRVIPCPKAGCGKSARPV